MCRRRGGLCGVICASPVTSHTNLVPRDHGTNPELEGRASGSAQNSTNMEHDQSALNSSRNSMQNPGPYLNSVHDSVTTLCPVLAALEARCSAARTLAELCRSVVRSAMGTRFYSSIDSLPLPVAMRDYVFRLS